MRIEEMSQDRGGLLIKVAYWFSVKRFGKISAWSHKGLRRAHTARCPSIQSSRHGSDHIGK